MSWGRRDWPTRQPRPRAAKLDPEALARLHVRATKFVDQSQVLRELLDGVQAARGHLYFWREPDDLMARVTNGHQGRSLAPRATQGLP